jgi:hypothetical protein
MYASCTKHTNRPRIEKSSFKVCHVWKKVQLFVNLDVSESVLDPGNYY